MAMAIHSAFSNAIHACTGLSSSALFTIVSLIVAVYCLLPQVFVAIRGVADQGKRSPSTHPEPERVQIGNVTLDELRVYDGSDPEKPILIAIKGQIYDVSKSRMLYGPGGPYALFAGRDTSRALALMSFDSNDLTGNTEGLGKAELEVLQDWELKFTSKYVKVGQVVPGKSGSGDSKSNTMNDNGKQKDTWMSLWNSYGWRSKQS